MKPVFPTIYSTLSPAALATLVSEKYGIKHAQCKLLVRGVGDTYLVESPARRFILRILAAIPYLSLGFWLFYGAFHTTHDQFYAFVQPAHLKLRAGLIRLLMEKYWDKETIGL